MDVTLLLSQNFLNGCGGSVRVAEGSVHEANLISTYDPSVGDHHQILGTQSINYASISKVCDTDIYTIEMILKEIIAQLKYQLKKGANIRIMFKVGRFIAKNGEISW